MIAALAGTLHRTLAVARKEFRQLVRDRPTLGMIVGIPALQLVLFGYAIDLDVRHVPTAVLDRAGTTLSRQLLGELAATQTFDLQRAVRSESQALELLQTGQVGAVVIVPPDFDRRLLRGRGAEISILADATNPTVAGAIALAGQGFGAKLAASPEPLRHAGSLVQDADLVRSERVRIEVLPFYNPEKRTPVFIVPGLLGVILTMTMMLMTALATVRERERGTFEFLIATPVKSGEVMVGKILPYLLVGHVQVAVVLFLGWLLFDVPIHGSLLDLGVAALPFLGAMLAMGLLVSAISRTQFQAMQLSFFFFLPSMLLSGFMFPFESMPRAAQWIGNVLPLTHFLRIVRAVLVKGASIDTLLDEVAAVSAFGVVALVLASLAFRKRLA
ncbi:MAG: ABC transporter permease [Myxococcota bacterium]